MRRVDFRPCSVADLAITELLLTQRFEYSIACLHKSNPRVLQKRVSKNPSQERKHLFAIGEVMKTQISRSLQEVCQLTRQTVRAAGHSGRLFTCIFDFFRNRSIL